MTETPADTRSRARRLRLPILSTIVLIALFGAWYYMATQQRTNYYVGRNLRLLATVTSEIDEKLAAQRGFVKNFADIDSWCDSEKPPFHPVTKYSRDATMTPWSKKFGEAYLPGFIRAERNDSPPGAQPGFETDLDGHLLTVSYHSETPASPSANVKQPSGEKDAGKPQCGLDPVRSASGQIDLRTVIQPVLQQTLLTDFDTILLAKGDGTVLVRVCPGANRARVSTPLDVASIASLREQQKTPFSAEVPIPLAELQQRTRYANVTIGGNDYVFFSQPYTYELPKGAGQWIVCAFMPREVFRHHVLTISPSLVVLIAAAILLALCAWPFLKLALIEDRSPVSLADAILLLVGILFGTAILTLMYADVFSYRRLRAVDDYQHRSFALSMKVDFIREVGQVIDAGKDLIQWSKSRKWTYRSLGDLRYDRDLRNKATYPSVDNYPFFSEFAFVDRDGQQQYHGVMKGFPAPLVSVAHRDYFTEVTKHPWVRSGDGTRYYVESVRSMATGKPEAVVSLQTQNPDLPVFAVTFPALHVASPVSPPGYEFAVIDDAGKVVFHSDETREGVENFFAETDYDRELRSAVFAHEERFVNTPYLGENRRIRVTPIDGTPWTLLTINDRRLLSAVNAEAVLLAVTSLAVWILLVLAVVAIVMAMRPHYRAPWLWPNPDRGADWARLRIVLVITVAAFAGTIYYLLPAASAIAAIVVPPQALGSMYLVLRRKDWSGATMLVGGLWAALTGLWIALIVGTGIHPDLLPPAARRFPEAGLVIAIVAAAVITLYRRNQLKPPRHYARAYVTCGALVVTVAAVLPTLAIFQATYRGELEAMIRFGQLRLAANLNHRLDFLAEQNWSNDAASALSYLIPFFYQSVWCLEPAPGEPRKCPCGNGSTASPPLATSAAFESRESLAAGLFEGMPSYNDETYGMRALLRASAADTTWRAWRSHRIAALTRPLRLAQDNISKTIDPKSGLARLTVVSRLPWLFTYDAKQPDPIGPYLVDPEDTRAKKLTTHLAPIPSPQRNLGGARALHFLGYAFAAAGLVFLIFAAAGFIARKVLLLEIVLVPPIQPGAKLDEKLRDNIFIVGLNDFAAYAGDAQYFPVDLRELADKSLWRDRLKEIEQSDKTLVLCEGAEYKIDDHEVTRRKIEFLDGLLESPNRTVVVISRVPVPAIVADSKYRAHWLRVLASFRWVDDRAFAPPRKDDKAEPARVFPFTPEYWRQAAHDVSAWIDALKKPANLTEEMERQVKAAPLFSGLYAADDSPSEYSRARAALISDAVAERTDRYYAALWDACSSYEQLALLQIAQHGFVNGDNRRVIRQLLGRGIIRRTPDLRFFSDSFRLFVIAQTAQVERECKDILPATTTWDNVRIPLLSILLIVTAVFLGTQKDLLNVTTAIASALAAGFPALAKLIASMTGRRVDTAAD